MESRDRDDAGRLVVTSTQLWPVEEELIQVWGADERTPTCQQPDVDAEHRHGLFFGEALSGEWRTYRSAGYPDKIAWSRCAVE